MNPFDHEHSDPWTEDLIDVESLNRDVTDAVAEQLDRARRESLEANSPRAEVMLVRGPAGSGKTHLFARLRRRLQHRAAFVLIRPEIGVAPSLRLLLGKVVEALSRKSYGARETQAAIIVGSTLGVLNGLVHFPQATLDELRASPDKREEAIEAVLDLVEQHHPDVSLNYLEQLLRVPFVTSSTRRGAMAWLGGNEPSTAQLKKIGHGGPLADAELMPALRALTLVAGLHSPLVLVFDQLENLYDAEDRPDRISAYGNLVAELYDSVPGLTTVQMAVDSEWSRRIRPLLSLPQQSRLEHRSFMLALPSATQRQELIEAWTARLPEAERVPPPFTESQVEAWCRQAGMTPRMLLIACRRALLGHDEDGLGSPGDVVAPGGVPLPAGEGGSVASEDDAPSDDGASSELDERLAELWDGALATSRAEVVRHQNDGSPIPAQRFVAAVAAVGRLAQATADTRRTPVNPTVYLARGGVTLAVCVLQGRGAGALGKALIAAATLAAEEPVLVVREAALAIPSTWRTVEQRIRELRAASRGRWLELDHEALARLIAVHDFEAMARAGDLSASDGTVIPREPAMTWLVEQCGWSEWPEVGVLTAMLSGDTSIDADADDVPSAVEGAATAKPLDASSAACTPAVRVLRRLHLASLERVVREARALDVAEGRESVLKALEAAGDQVVWLGSSLVCTREVAS